VNQVAEPAKSLKKCHVMALMSSIALTKRVGLCMFMQYDQIACVPYVLKKNGDNGYITYDDAFFHLFRVWYSD